MKAQIVTLRVLTDIDLSDSTRWSDFERLVKGYPSSIEHAELVEVEIIMHGSEGLVTTA